MQYPFIGLSKRIPYEKAKDRKSSALNQTFSSKVGPAGIATPDLSPLSLSLTKKK